MKYYIHMARIEAERHRFPVDMLRYDACYPATQEDSRKVEFLDGRATTRDERQVVVHRISVERQPKWNVDRWRSFGCTLTLLGTQVVHIDGRAR